MGALVHIASKNNTLTCAIDDGEEYKEKSCAEQHCYCLRSGIETRLKAAHDIVNAKLSMW